MCLTPLKREEKGRRIRQEEPETAVQPSEDLSQADEEPWAEIVYQKWAMSGRSDLDLMSPPCSVIDWEQTTLPQQAYCDRSQSLSSRGHNWFFIGGKCEWCTSMRHNSFPHTLEKHLSMGSTMRICSGSFIMVVHRATNNISELDYMALQVAFKTIAGSFDGCLYFDYKQQWEEPASGKIPHT